MEPYAFVDAETQAKADTTHRMGSLEVKKVKRLIELAQKIENRELRKKVIAFLKDPKLTSREFKNYEPEKIDIVKTPFTVGGVTVERGNLIRHMTAVTKLCIDVAEMLEKEYGIPIDKDSLIAGAILHDIMKVYEWRVEGGEIKHTGVLLDHSMLAVAELYRRDFPEKVIHLVASHLGAGSSTPPRNFEALILHHVDTLLSSVEFHLYGEKQQPLQIVILDEKTMKKLTGEKTDK